MRIKLTYLLLFSLLASSCIDKEGGESTGSKKNDEEEKAVVKKYYNEGKLVKEVTFKYDIRNGICRNYYSDGRLKRTIWYENGRKEDTAKWFYREGMVYRATPYSSNEIHGVQTKYYKNGRVQATLPYKNGLRMQGLREYLPDGRDEGGYPDIDYMIKDASNEDPPVIKIITRLTNESVNVKFFRGRLVDGVFDPAKCTDITTSSGMGYLELSKDNTRDRSHVNIIAIYATRFRNRKIITKRIPLP